MSILRHAANEAFWTIPQPKSLKLADDRGVDCGGKTMSAIVKALVIDIIGTLALDALLEMLPKRGVERPKDIPDELDDDIVADVLGDDATKGIEDP